MDSQSRALTGRISIAAVLAGVLVAGALAGVLAQQGGTTEAQRFEQAVTLFEVRGEYAAAARLFEALSKSTNREVAARSLVYLGACLERMGGDARAKYRQVIEEYGDQVAAVRDARRRLTALSASSPPPSRRPSIAMVWRDLPRGSGMVGRASSDGRFLAVPCRTGPCEFDHAIVILEMRSGTEVRRFHLPHSEESALNDSFIPSPEGRQAACTWWVRGQPSELRIVGSSIATRTLFRADAREHMTIWSWSPGGYILVSLERPGAPSRILLVSVADGSTTTVTEASPAPNFASLSPDGRFVAFALPAGDHGRRGGVFTARVADHRVTDIASGPWTDGQPLWTLDGRWLLFTSNRTGVESLCGVRMTLGRPVGHEVEVLQEDLGRWPMPFGIDASGNYYYWRQSGFIDVFAIGLDDQGMPVGKPKLIDLDRRGEALMPALWSGGSERKLAFVDILGSRLGIRDLRTGVERRIDTALNWVRAPRWSDDGARLVVRGDDGSEGSAVYQVDAATGRKAAIVLPTPEGGSVSCQQVVPHPGPLRIAYVVTLPDGASVLRRFDVDSGSVVDLLRIEKTSRLALLEPARTDDSFLLSLVNEVNATTVAIWDPSGKMRPLMTVQAPEFILALTWTPDHKSVFITRGNRKEKTSRVWKVDVASGQASAIDVIPGDARDFSISPDSQMLAFSSGEPYRDVWLVSNFLPANGSGRAAARPNGHGR